MNTFVKAILIIVLGLPLAVAECQEDQGTPAEQYAAIIKEYGPASGGMRIASTDLQRKEFVGRLAEFPSKFATLAEKYPNDPIALESLRQAVQALGSTDSAAQIAWETNRADFPTGGSDDAAAQIVALILRDHVLSEKLGPVIDRLRYSYRLQAEECLRVVLEQNPHRDVQALACLGLAQFLNDRLRMLQLVEDRQELESCYEIVFGKDYLPQLRKLGQAELESRIESLFQRAVIEFSDVKNRDSTVGEMAKSELYALHHLNIGSVAPDILGLDQDGVHFKLSDYRGKVILLYFWSEF